MRPGMSVRASTPPARVRAASAARQDPVLVFALAAAILAVVLLVGVVFSGSPGKLAPGTKIAGVDVGGLSATDATALLERQQRAVSHVPVTFVAGTHRFRLRPDELSVAPNWAEAVARAQAAGDGMDVIRGFKR